MEKREDEEIVQLDVHWDSAASASDDESYENEMEREDTYIKPDDHQKSQKYIK